MRARGILCPSCEGLLAEVREARADPEHPAGDRRWRVMACGDCPARYVTIEQLAPDQDAAWQRLSELAAERRRLARLA